MNPDLGPYCLHYRLPKKKKQMREQTTSHDWGGLGLISYSTMMYLYKM